MTFESFELSGIFPQRLVLSLFPLWLLEILREVQLWACTLRGRLDQGGCYGISRWEFHVMAVVLAWVFDP